MCRKIKVLRLLFLFSFSIAMASVLAIVTSKQVYADCPAVQDFGQQKSGVRIGEARAYRALFVTEAEKGICKLEEHRIHDDSITGFAGEHPAWRLNVPLTWYFLETVYERNTSNANLRDGRIAV
jgi:hypothetical protein